MERLIQTLKKWCVGSIKLYQYLLSPLLPVSCRFEPCCSDYARQALSRFGLIEGVWLAIKRLLSCHPWHHGGYDPVPTRNKRD